MKQRLSVIIVFLMGAFFLFGCQESDSDIIKRAKLVGNENIQLKQQLAQKDKEIQSLKDKITQLDADIEKLNMEFGESTIKTLTMVAETTKRNEALATEIKQLKEQLKQLQDK